jgi:hypothetical protein
MTATELVWFKSSHSGSSGDDCVEVALTHEAVHVRDSKDTSRPPFVVGRECWTQFVGFAADGVSSAVWGVLDNV